MPRKLVTYHAGGFEWSIDIRRQLNGSFRGHAMCLSEAGPKEEIRTVETGRGAAGRAFVGCKQLIDVLVETHRSEVAS